VASVLGETDTLEQMSPLLRSLEQDKDAQRACDVHMAMMEVIWSPSHTDREIGLSRLTELTNALLRSRGEVFEYSANEIGWKLRSLGFHRHRNGQGMVVRFLQETRRLIHELAANWGLNLGKCASCTLCALQESIDANRLM
jgi:hypothetical protein